ncbi:DUF6557 family protein [Wukongibacter baidiensis]
MRNLKDRRLLEIINIDYDEYTEEALEVAREELANRGIKNFLVSDRNKLGNVDNPKYITFRDLILQTRFKEVLKNIIRMYPRDKSLNENYEKTFNELIQTDSSNIDSTCIFVEERENIYDPLVKDWEVFGQDVISKEKFEIDYLEWKDWLSCLIDTDQVMMIGKECYVAHCIYCMTKNGFSQEDVNKNFNNLKVKQVGDELILDNKVVTVEQYQETHPWIRFWARSIDYIVIGIVLSFVWTLVPAHLGRAIYSIQNIIYITPFVWIFIETVLISKTGTTIGKWILNIKIRDSKGELLSYKESFYRSSLVWISGLGFGIHLVQILTQIHAYFKLQKSKTTMWDEKVNSQIIYGQIGVWRVLIAVCILAVIPLVQSLSNFY